MRLPLLVMVSCLAVPAWGQTQPQPDNAAILKAIQGLSTRIDGLQQDVDQLKRKAAKTPATPPNAPKPAAPKASSVAGWLINVVPPTDDDDANAVAAFAGPVSSYDFSLHTKLVSGQQQFQYFGEAFFHANEDGHYIFLMEAAPVYTHNTSGPNPWQFNCAVRMSVQGNRIIDAETKYKTMFRAMPANAPFSSQTQTFQAGVDLPAGDYPITFRAGCFLNESIRADPLVNSFQLWQHNTIRLLVRTPDDSAPRAFAPNELFHVIKAKTP